ncbi:Uncharacterized conserved protein YkwD, contains CAP (CSP/antigen 5/PR1) domain [Neorhodopirellula lusitana]|uniref:Uncharacterized conserved protein YkwD, contains CAP (CSP/antigen 5/PR1) domain n=1 Tax=Neorhodopirellula lusitana TaxID=445327 RepID=A0ABY1QDW6_9BACT|nr:CAP domain-containing protein [Neorhodopirellula lusitana]SMP66989.1 Uncharacterized conserved protein YkwD, contains CAP (CSP/antigen 5/PR1) domain [Neorhodopirellula lusitana]
MKHATFSILLLGLSLSEILTPAAASVDESSLTSAEPDSSQSRERSSDMISSVERAIITQTNEFRKSKDLDSVEPENDLTKAAENFAKFMAKTGKYGHRANGMTPAERAKEAGYDYCVVRENIAYRTNTGEVSADDLIEVFVQGWIDSPPHRENMLADYVTHTGVAVATTDDVTFYAVQLFGRPKSAAFQLEISNQSGEPQTVVFTANDQSDEVEIQPRTTLKMTRCLPTFVSLTDSDKSTKVESDIKLTINEDGIVGSRDN